MRSDRSDRFKARALKREELAYLDAKCLADPDQRADLDV